MPEQPSIVINVDYAVVGRTVKGVQYAPRFGQTLADVDTALLRLCGSGWTTGDYSNEHVNVEAYEVHRNPIGNGRVGLVGLPADDTLRPPEGMTLDAVMHLFESWAWTRVDNNQEV